MRRLSRLPCAIFRSRSAACAKRRSARCCSASGHRLCRAPLQPLFLRLLPLLLLARAGSAGAWVNYFHDGRDGDRLYRWNAPSSFTSDAGLAGGLTWAAQDDFCGKLLPQFYA